MAHACLWHLFCVNFISPFFFDFLFSTIHTRLTCPSSRPLHHVSFSRVFHLSFYFPRSLVHYLTSLLSLFTLSFCFSLCFLPPHPMRSLLSHHPISSLSSTQMLGRMVPHQRSARMHMYAPLLSQLRLVLVARMAKPEEVLVVEDGTRVLCAR